MDSNLPPPPPPHATTTDHGRAVANLKSLLVKCAIFSTPAQPLPLEQQAFFEKRIQDLALAIHTPDHPPYACMIENAIKRLSEDGVSDEATISKFILDKYKNLPWAHAAFLKHHLKRLSGDGTLFQGHDGRYSIDTERITSGRGFNPGLRLTCTTSPSPSPDLTSPGPSSSSSPTYASSDTSSSSQTFDPKMEHKEKHSKRRKTQRQKQNARGMRIHPNYKRGQGRACGQGRGRGRGRGNPCLEDMMEEEADDTCMHGKSAKMVEIRSLIEEDEAADGQLADDLCMHDMKMVDIYCLTSDDEESIQLPPEQANQDYVGVEVVDIDSLEHELRTNEAIVEPLQHNNGDSCSTSSAIPWSQRRKLTSEQGSKKVRQLKRNISSRSKPQPGMRRGRSRNKETGNNMHLLEATEIRREQPQLKGDQCYQHGNEAYLMNNENTPNLMEVEIQYVDQVEQEGDNMDEFNEEACGELIEGTKALHLTIDDEADEGSLQRNDQPVSKRLGIENTGVSVKEKELSQHLEHIKLSEQGTNRGRQLKPVPSRNESNNVADRSESSNTLPKIRMRRNARGSSRRFQ